MAAAPAQPGIMQQQADPLARLRDIHQPGMIETWPPAPGWWILAGLALVALIALVTWLFLHWRRNRYRREALKELAALEGHWQANGDDAAYLQALQKLLKRVALTAFPREQVASLTGEAWLQFLDNSTNSHDFSIGEAEALIDGNYRPDISIDVPALQIIAARWINDHQREFLLKNAGAAA